MEMKPFSWMESSARVRRRADKEETTHCGGREVLTHQLDLDLGKMVA